MNTGITAVIPRTCELLGLGEPTHGEPAFGWVRNAVIGELVDHGFRSIALETDRVAALTLNEYVRTGQGTLDNAMKRGFSHSFGESLANRQLVEWLRDHNLARPAAERVAVYGFDAPTEFAGAPSPRGYLQHAIDYLDADITIDDLAGDDDRWSRSEAVMDAHMSPGDTAQAETLRSVSHDLLTSLYARAPELIAATSRSAWRGAEAHVKTALGLLAYHKQAAQPLDAAARWSALLAIRDAIMAQNLLDIRTEEAHRGPTLVFAHNRHLQRERSQWRLGEMELAWSCAGAIVSSLIDEHYTFVAGSLGASTELGLDEPELDTYEGQLDRQVEKWGVTAKSALISGHSRTDVRPEQGYFPLDEPTIRSADTILHISNGDVLGTTSPETGSPQEEGAQK